MSAENSTNAMNKKHPEKQIGKENLYHSDYRFSLRLRVHYRINEEAIRCLLLVRWVLAISVVCQNDAALSCTVLTRKSTAARIKFCGLVGLVHR